jgi:hypothetical protein
MGESISITNPKLNKIRITHRAHDRMVIHGE